MKIIYWVVGVLALALTELAFAQNFPECEACPTFDSHHLETPIGLEANPSHPANLEILLQQQTTLSSPSSLAILSVREAPSKQHEGFGTFLDPPSKNTLDQDILPFKLTPYDLLGLFGDEHP